MSIPNQNNLKRGQGALKVAMKRLRKFAPSVSIQGVINDGKGMIGVWLSNDIILTAKGSLLGVEGEGAIVSVDKKLILDAALERAMCGQFIIFLMDHSGGKYYLFNAAEVYEDFTLNERAGQVMANFPLKLGTRVWKHEIKITPDWVDKIELT